MDSKFLEFYGRSLLNAAKGQKQFEQFRDLMKPVSNGAGFTGPGVSGFKGFEAMEALFRKCYGLAPVPEEDTRNKAMEEMLADFHSSFVGFARQMGWVPLKEQTELSDRVAALEKKTREQQAVIDGFKRALGLEGPLGYPEILEGMNRMGQEQNRQIKNVMQTFFDAFDNTGKSPD